jgi:xanthine dehydrogenase YagS FAD-binding subunit
VKAFDYLRARDVGDALELRKHSVESRYLAGGTNLVDLMKTGVETPDRIVDIRALPLDSITLTPDGSLRIGATATNSDLAAHPDVRRRYPALSEALLAGASGQLRNAATVGGNLLQRTRCAYFTDLSAPCNKRAPGSGCAALSGEHHNHAVLEWTVACVATHPSDMAVAMTALDARISYVTSSGAGELPISRFYLPVGTTPHQETALPEGALITHVTLPHTQFAARSRYRKVRERASYAFALGAVAAAISLEDGRVTETRIALGAVAARPWRARAAEADLRGKPANPVSFADAADAELAAARSLPGNGFKVRLVRNLIISTLSELVERQAGTA